MKDTQSFPSLPQSWNGGVMSGGGGPENDRGSQFPPWPPRGQRPIPFDVPFELDSSFNRRMPNMVPGMVGSFFRSRASTPYSTSAPPFPGSVWMRGMKPDNGVFVLNEPSSNIPAEGMDLTNRATSVANGAQVNGQTKGAVSVIATNPLRTDKPSDPSDKSDDDDEDRMVIEEGEEAPSVTEPSQSQQSNNVKMPSPHDLSTESAASKENQVQTGSVSSSFHVRSAPSPTAPVSSARFQNQYPSPPKLPLAQTSFSKPSNMVMTNVSSKEPRIPPTTTQEANPLTSLKLSTASPPVPPTFLQRQVTPPQAVVPSTPQSEPTLPSSAPAKHSIPVEPVSASKESEPTQVHSASEPKNLTAQKDPPVAVEAPTISIPTPDLGESTSKLGKVSPISNNASQLPTEPIPSTADHVESMLENMFQQEDTPIHHPVIVPNNQRTPALTDDKVVAILEESESPTKPEVKPDLPVKNNTFMQVESELEKMFAGIVEPDDEKDVKPEIESIEINKPSPELLGVEKPPKRKRPAKPRVRKTDSDLMAKRNKKSLEIKSKKKVGAREKITKDVSNDSSIIISKFRGPYIKLVGSKENPKSVTVVNSAGREEEEERATEKVKRKKAPRIIEGRVTGAGLYSSTLAPKYNSTIVDATWVCIFCKKRPHCEAGLGGEAAGDLFGPYIVHIKLEQEPPPGTPSDSDLSKEQRKKGSGKKLSLRTAKSCSAFTQQVAKKTKAALQGKALAASEEESPTREVWVHEQCAIWAPGVILVGPHLIGLEDAIAASLNTKCEVCKETGATIGCMTHNCDRTAHYGCALQFWAINSSTFQAYCLDHAKNSLHILPI